MRLLIADDHTLFRHSLRNLLEVHGLEVLGEATNGRESIDLAIRLQPDVVLLDLSMPEMSGLEAITRLRALSPQLDALAGKTVILGVLALDDERVETPDEVAERIRRALPHKPAGDLIAAPDCGMKYLSREAAYGKLEALVAGARIVRDEVVSAPELA